MLAIDWRVQEIIFLEIENVWLRDPIESNLHIASPVSVRPDRDRVNETRTNAEAVDDEKDRERTITPVFPKKENEWPPGIKERIATGDKHCDRAGEVFQLWHDQVVR